MFFCVKKNYFAIFSNQPCVTNYYATLVIPLGLYLRDFFSHGQNLVLKGHRSILPQVKSIVGGQMMRTARNLGLG